MLFDRGGGKRRSRAAAALMVVLAAALAFAGPTAEAAREGLGKKSSEGRPGSSARLRAGAAASDITPPVGTPMFAYTARSGLANPPMALQILADPDENLYAKSFVPSRGIHTRVWARAIVLEQDGRKFALVQADLGGLPHALVQEVERRIERTGIDAERLLISATHTHSSTGPIWPPDNGGYGLLGGDAFDPRVFELTAEGIAEAILAADARLTRAQAGIGEAELSNASRNRSFEAFQRNPETPEEESAARAASIDPTVTVIRIDAIGGQPLAAWSNFAIHPTSLGADNLLFSGDNVASAERFVEQRIAGAGRPRGARRASGATRTPGNGPVNAWTNASEGDISPNGDPQVSGAEALEYVPSDYASAHLAGIRVGRGIVEAWLDAGGRMRSSLALGARRTFLAFDGTAAAGEPVGPVPVLGAGEITGPAGFCAPFEGMAGPGQGRKFPQLAGPGLVPQIVPVSVWRVGPLAIGAFPAEITRQMGARLSGAIEAEAGGEVDRAVIAGLTNGYISYAATPEEYDACHYEGSFTLFGRRQGVRYMDVARGLSGALFSRSSAPPGAPEPPPLGITSDPLSPLRITPEAGEPVSEPEPVVRRYERASFRWRGGDPGVDAPRGSAFVSLQRAERGEWHTVSTEDSYFDLTHLDRDGVWNETHQFTECDPVGSYRFLVRGAADRGARPEPYEVASLPFELRPITSIQADPPVVSGGEVTVRARYPDPGAGAIVALPRVVRTGYAVLRITEPAGTVREVVARPDQERLLFVAPAREGSTAELLRIEDGCGNTGP